MCNWSQLESGHSVNTGVRIKSCICICICVCSAVRPDEEHAQHRLLLCLPFRGSLRPSARPGGCCPPPAAPDACTHALAISKEHNELRAASRLPKLLQRHRWLWKRASKKAGWAPRQHTHTHTRPPKKGLYSSDNLFAMNNSASFCCEAELNTEH